MLTVLENCRVSPPPSTVGDKSLPLTFFDAIWLLFFPISHVFFYELPHPKSYFLETIVPKLKHSLSITLQHFFPFAGNLIVIPNPNRCFNGKKPKIRHVEGDSVALTFAEYKLDFNELTGNHTRECHKFYPLIPLLGQPSKVYDYVTIPLFSLQAWTSIAKHGTDELFLASGSLPFYERVIEYPESLDEIYFNQPGIETIDEGYKIPHLVGGTDKARATLVLTQAHINRLKKWLSTQSPTLEYVSSFSVACAYVWSCIAKARARTGEQKGENDNDGDDDLERFIFPVDWRSRIHPPLPPTYVGNCLGPCITTLTKRSLLAGNKGFQTAAELVGKALSETLKTKDALLKDADTWLERAYEPVLMIGVSGTPKMKVYDIDFGWGKPKKHETPSIDYNGSISVNASKDSAGDIEIGISLPTKQMDAFISISRSELESTFYDQDE
ncbi:hypothetical protein L1987_58136 [Smallanthus sonchifolius]|uniref:Uncharacterized protein n=1 Tax=Smallanthus sonchifolius TaxID=185202 RepID=A0ACB9DEW7_9ASTR|nr:hypothetical protein L1987_58136 [Smallanthus sonchifolius]